MLSSNINNCQCKYSGKEKSPTGNGYCAKCHLPGTQAYGTDRQLWVLKKKDGKNYWAKAPIKNIKSDGKMWHCNSYTEIETTPVEDKTIVPTKNITTICSNGICKVQPQEARYYVIDNLRQAKGLMGGDIVKINGKDTTFIMSSDNRAEKLTVDPNGQYVIPTRFYKEFGQFYWNNISNKANLADMYNIYRYEKLCIQIEKGFVNIGGLRNIYGDELVEEIVATHKPRKKSKTTATKTPRKKSKTTSTKTPQKKSKTTSTKTPRKKSKTTTKKSNSKCSAQKGRFEDRTVAELRNLAKCRGIKLKNGARKTEIITALRGKTKSGSRCYEAMSKKDLLQRAAKKGISGRSKMTKQQLINKLRS